MDKYIEHEQGMYRPLAGPGFHHGETLMGRRPLPDDNWPYVDPQNGHDPQYGIRSPKFYYHVYIRRDQVFYDVDTQIAMMNAGRRKDDGSEEEATASSTEKFRPMFYRWIDKHIGLAKGQMAAFVLEEHTTAAMNGIKDDDEVDITLLMPEWWDATVLGQLTQSVHDYVVNAVLHEYLSIALVVPTRNGMSTDPLTASKKEQADEALHNVKIYVNAAKPGRVRKIQKPF